MAAAETKKTHIKQKHKSTDSRRNPKAQKPHGNQPENTIDTPKNICAQTMGRMLRKHEHLQNDRILLQNMSTTYPHLPKWLHGYNRLAKYY